MIQAIFNVLNQKNEFSKRIISRNEIFWNAPDVTEIRTTLFNATDPISKWKNTENWQRRLSNKYNSREFAKMHGCRVPELYWKGSDLTTINFTHLPENYVIRPTKGHSCNHVFLMKNGGNLFDQCGYTEQEIKEVLNDALKYNYTPEFLIEEFLTTEEGEHEIPDDYKIYTFNGEIAGIAVINRLSQSSGYVSFFDQNWRRLEKISTNTYKDAAIQQKPNCFDEILHHAKLLSKTYKIFVRVDFYATARGAVFGEFTPTPSVGKGFTPFGENLFTTYWDKYCSGLV